MKAPRCKICGDEHWGNCPKFAGTARDRANAAIKTATENIAKAQARGEERQAARMERKVKRGKGKR